MHGYVAGYNTNGSATSLEVMTTFGSARRAWEELRDVRREQLEAAAAADTCPPEAGCPWSASADTEDAVAVWLDLATVGTIQEQGAYCGATPGHHGIGDLGTCYWVQRFDADETCSDWCQGFPDPDNQSGCAIHGAL